MGVTVHFEGRLTDQTAYDRLMHVASDFAYHQGWLTEPINVADAKLLRVRDEKEWDYFGPTKGMMIYPHEDCEPVRLEFDRDLYVQEYTKTQFAGPEIHLQVLELFRAIEPCFANFKVEDEGEYWETHDIQRLRHHLDSINGVIEEESKKAPSVRVKVKLESGRIIDLIQ